MRDVLKAILLLPAIWLGNGLLAWLVRASELPRPLAVPFILLLPSYLLLGPLPWLFWMRTTALEP